MAFTTTYVSTAIERSRTTLSVLVALLLVGWVSYLAIPVESAPDVAVPIFVVTVPHEGISPEDAERLLSRPVELELKAVEGVEEVNSYSREGSAVVVVEFDYDLDPDDVLIDVREAVDRARVKMPDSTEEPFIEEVAAAEFPIITVSLGGERVPDRVLYRLARDLRDELESIPEVLEANLNGDREELLEAVIDPALLEAYGITNDELATAVARNNRLIAAGALDTGRGSFSVKVPSLIEEVSDVLSIPVKATPDGVITIADVTTLRRTFKDATNYTRSNGTPAVAVEVSKRKGVSLVEAVEKVKEAVEAERISYPSEVIVSYMADQAPETIEQINTLQGNISTAMFLVLTVVVAAVGLRSGLLVAMGIPFSFLFAFMIVNLLGFTYNFMVMFGMLLGLGMLIDGAIVVVELADRRLAEGIPPREAYSYSIRRMFWPVVASTATTLAAFLPLMFWPGVTGGFMRYLPVTVFAVLVGSLLYALLFAPVLGALISRAASAEETSNDFVQVDQGRFEHLSGVVGLYAKVLLFTTRHPLLVIFVALISLYGIIWLYGEKGNGTQFFTEVEPTFGQISVNAKGNYSASELLEIVKDVEQRILNEGRIKSVYTRSGGGGINIGGSGGSASDRIGSMFIELSDRRTRDDSGFEVLEDFRHAVSDVPGVRVEVDEPEQGPPVGKDIQIQLAGTDLDLLTQEARRIRAHLEGMSDLRDVDDTTAVPGIEWELSVDRAKAAMLGADVTSVGTAVQLVTNGVLVGRYRPDDVDDEVDIRVRYPESHRAISRLDDLRVSTNQGAVPISSFVERSPQRKIGTIFRQDGHRIMYVRANTREGVLPDDMVQQIRQWLTESAAIDPSIKVVFRGANEEQAESIRFVGTAFTLSLALMGILLITQFNSFYQSTLILSAVIMSTVGVLLGLIILDQPFSAIMTGVGIVALAGIIVNNNIVLIDTFNYLRRENPGWNLSRVIVTTGCQRLRPVFLTTFTTGFGLLPMASGVSIDLIGREVEIGGPVATFWVQLASAIVSGLTFATVLTLIVTPAMLMAPQALGRLGRRIMLFLFHFMLRDKSTAESES